MHIRAPIVIIQPRLGSCCQLANQGLNEGEWIMVLKCCAAKLSVEAKRALLLNLFCVAAAGGVRVLAYQLQLFPHLIQQKWSLDPFWYGIIDPGLDVASFLLPKLILVSVFCGANAIRKNKLDDLPSFLKLPPMTVGAYIASFVVVLGLETLAHLCTSTFPSYDHHYPVDCARDNNFHNYISHFSEYGAVAGFAAANMLALIGFAYAFEKAYVCFFTDDQIGNVHSERSGSSSMFSFGSLRGKNKTRTHLAWPSDGAVDPNPLLNQTAVNYP